MTSHKLIAGLTASLALGAGLLAVAPAAAARPMTPAERRHMPLSPDMPACADPGILAKISGRFASREWNYWDSGLSIASFDRISEIGYRSNGLDYVPRRYCTARAIMSNGSTHKVTYAIASDLGWLGVLGYGVDWCVDGLDRNHAYGGHCRAARP